MIISDRKNNFVSTSTLTLLAFSTVFFSRTLDALGAPSLINFAHFFFVPLAFGVALVNMRARDPKQTAAVQALIGALVIFLTANLLSAAVNSAGLINAVLNFLLYTEPFMMLVAIASIPISSKRLQQLKKWIVIFALYNLVLVYIQQYVMGTVNPDYLYGAFFSVAGATVSAIVSSVFAVYYLFSKSTSSLWPRIAIVVAAFWQIIISDTKLVLGSFIIGFALFSLSKINSKTLLYVISGAFFFLLFFWSLDNVPFFAPYALWIKPEELTNFDSPFYNAKLMAFEKVPEYYDSAMGYIVGVGPGHGVSRLGGWMMEKYSYLLDPIGATHPFLEMSEDILGAAADESRDVIGTAMYAPLFSWAGLWSELGIVGMASYASLWITVWHRYCLHDFSRLLVMATVVTGLFPGYLEEPSSLLFTTFVIGLWWHEERLRANQKTANRVFRTAIKEDLAVSAE